MATPARKSHGEEGIGRKQTNDSGDATAIIIVRKAGNLVTKCDFDDREEEGWYDARKKSIKRGW